MRNQTKNSSAGKAAILVAVLVVLAGGIGYAVLGQDSKNKENFPTAGKNAAAPVQIPPFDPIVNKKNPNQSDATGPTDSGDRATIEFPSLEHDFGEIWVGTQLNYVFEVKNTGNLPLELLKIKPSCGCTVAKNYDKTIAPGATGKIPITLNSKRLNGQFTKTIRVTSNDPNRETVTLRVKGNAKPYVQINPRFVNFPTIKAHEEKSAKVKLTNNSPQPLKLTLPRQKFGQSFTAELIEKIPGEEYELLVHAKPPYREGPNRANIQIKTNIAEQPLLSIRTTAIVKPTLEVLPKQLLIRQARNKEWTQRITLTNNGESPVILLSASSNEEKFGLAIEPIREGFKYVVKVTIPGGYTPPESGRTIILETDDPKKSKLTVPVRTRPKRPSRPAQKLVGKQAPATSFKTNAGESINTAALNFPATVMKFYTTWCPHCKRSLPLVEKVYQEFKDKGVKFLAISQDDPNDANRRRRFTPEQTIAKLKEMGVTFDLILDPQKKIGQAFKASSYPTMFLLDKNGKIVNVYIGGMRANRIDEFKRDLEKILLAQGNSTAPSKD